MCFIYFYFYFGQVKVYWKKFNKNKKIKAFENQKNRQPNAAKKNAHLNFLKKELDNQLIYNIPTYTIFYHLICMYVASFHPIISSYKLVFQNKFGKNTKKPPKLSAVYNLAS
jgi:hypothetical protein